MAVELQYESIIIPIANIDKCKSLGGFEKFIESQKDRIGDDVWHDEYLYRYRLPDSDDDKILKFWEDEGLQPLKPKKDDSKQHEWNDLCLARETGPTLTCDWLEVDKGIPCVWLKGKPMGELHGSKRRISKVISKSAIDDQYYRRFFDSVYQFMRNIPPVSKAFRTISNLRFEFAEAISDQWRESKKFNWRYLILCPISWVSQVILIFYPSFNVTRFLKVFDLIKIDRGFKLDYVYYGDSPTVYTKQKFPTLNLFKSNKLDRTEILGPYNREDIEDISFDKSPEGYFQFAVFSVVVHQFYLYWHACYNDTKFIYSKSQIEDILKSILKDQYRRAIRYKEINRDLSSEDIDKKVDAELLTLFYNRKSDDDLSIFLGPLIEEECTDSISGETFKIQNYWTTEEELKALFSASLEPLVTIQENGYGVVRVMTFSKWSGFEYCYSYIKYPNEIEKVRTERILSYDCGIMF